MEDGDAGSCTSDRRRAAKRLVLVIERRQVYEDGDAAN